MTLDAMEHLTDLDFDLMQMTDDELDAFAMASAEPAEHELATVHTLASFEASRKGTEQQVAAFPDRAAA